MAIRFTQGASLRATRVITKPAVNPRKNSMKGMPGYITTGQDKSSGGLKDSSGMGPHREGPIGKKTGSSVKGKFDTGKFRGSSDKSYRATSTWAPGRVVSNKSSPARGASEAERPARGKPTSGFKQYGGSGGKMESLRGRAKFSMER